MPWPALMWCADAASVYFLFIEAPPCNLFDPALFFLFLILMPLFLISFFLLQMGWWWQDEDVSFDKFNIRHRLNRLLVFLWDHPLAEPKASVLAFIAAEPAAWAAAVHAALDTVVYNLEDALRRMADGREHEKRHAGGASAASAAFVRRQQETAKGFLARSNSSLDWLNHLAAASPTVQASLASPALAVRRSGCVGPLVGPPPRRPSFCLALFSGRCRRRRRRHHNLLGLWLLWGRLVAPPRAQRALTDSAGGWRAGDCLLVLPHVCCQARCAGVLWTAVNWLVAPDRADGLAVEDPAAYGFGDMAAALARPAGLLARALGAPAIGGGGGGGGGGAVAEALAAHPDFDPETLAEAARRPGGAALAPFVPTVAAAHAAAAAASTGGHGLGGGAAAASGPGGGAGLDWSLLLGGPDPGDEAYAAALGEAQQVRWFCPLEEATAGFVPRHGLATAAPPVAPLGFFSPRTHEEATWSCGGGGGKWRTRRFNGVLSTDLSGGGGRGGGRGGGDRDALLRPRARHEGQERRAGRGRQGGQGAAEGVPAADEGTAPRAAPQRDHCRALRPAVGPLAATATRYTSSSQGGGGGLRCQWAVTRGVLPRRPSYARALITGPADTPYFGGAFVLDIYFPESYPEDPPLVQLVTTGKGTVRFNPNLWVALPAPPAQICGGLLVWPLAMCLARQPATPPSVSTALPSSGTPTARSASRSSARGTPGTPPRSGTPRRAPSTR